MFRFHCVRIIIIAIIFFRLLHLHVLAALQVHTKNSGKNYDDLHTGIYLLNILNLLWIMITSLFKSSSVTHLSLFLHKKQLPLKSLSCFIKHFDV